MRKCIIVCFILLLLLHFSENALAQNFSHKCFENKIGDSLRIFTSAVKFSYDTFKKEANFHTNTFQKDADFSYSKFCGIAKFVETMFWGDARFRKCEFSSAAAFQNGTFKKNVDFDSCKFFNDANFYYSNFDSFASFNQSVFYSACSLQGAHFQHANFIQTHFKKLAYFARDTFEKKVHFDTTKFYEKSVFSYDSFKSDATYIKCLFNDTTYFDYASFKGIANFGLAIFNNVRFFYTKFYNESFFDHAKFNGTANFSGIKAYAKMYFREAILPDTLDFSDVRDVNEIDLSVANFQDANRYDTTKKKYKEGKWHYINLYKADISKFHLDYDHFRLLIPTIKGKGLPADEAKTIYEGLLKNFKDRGQTDSYEKLDIEYQKFIWKNRPQWVNYLWVVPYHWNRFGYEKGLVFCWTITFLLLLTLATYFSIDRLINTVYPVDHIPTLYPLKRYKGLHKYFNGKRWWYSLVYTFSVFFLLSLKVDKIQFNNKRGIIYLLLMYALGVICLAYMANFIFQR